jgi:hypothetical protein
MPQNPENIVNPGLVNVVDQGDGLLAVDQPVLVGPGTNPGPLVSGSSLKPGIGADCPDQPVLFSEPATTALRTVQGGTASPTSADTINTTENNVAGQVYGQGTPANVFV